MNQDQDKPSDVLVFVEQDGTSRFKIQSNQLEHIGAQLRGPRQFSIFTSIVLPLIVSIATIIFSTLFQYVSWLNSVRLQNASENVTRAAETYEKIALAIGKRNYATLVFIPVLRDLARAQPPGSDLKLDVANPLLATESVVAKFDVELKKRRFESYYELLRNWNENYDQLITAVDYDLDRAVLLQAELSSEGVQVFAEKINKIDCTKSLTTQLDAADLNRHSLKLQFAGIHHCFRLIHATVDKLKSGTAAPGLVKFDDQIATQIAKSLSDAHTMSNEFRCYALRRIDYYRRQKEKSILSPKFLINRVFDKQKAEAMEHFESTAARCAPGRRLADANSVVRVPS